MDSVEFRRNAQIQIEVQFLSEAVSHNGTCCWLQFYFGQRKGMGSPQSFRFCARSCRKTSKVFVGDLLGCFKSKCHCACSCPLRTLPSNHFVQFFCCKQRMCSSVSKWVHIAEHAERHFGLKHPRFFLVNPSSPTKLGLPLRVTHKLLQESSPFRDNIWTTSRNLVVRL